jgi:tetratricopeptide (TPR) repeat protein
VLPSAHSLVTTQAASTPAALNFKRYSYGSLSAPVPGHRAEALAKFSEGVAAQRAGDSNTAMAAYRSAIRADPTLFDAYYNLGVAAYDAGQMSVSLSAYESALVLRPDSRDTRYNFALAMRLADYPVDAAAELTKLLASNPNDAQVHFTLANLYGQQLGRPRLAREHFERVLAIEPNHPQAEAIRRWLAANPG